MKFRSGRVLLGAVLTAAGLSAAPLEPAAQGSGTQVPELLIAKLSDESYAVREAATREIWKFGEAALPDLRNLAEGRDPEAAIRARDLIRKIELGILPDSSAKIVELVMRYDRGSIDERQRVIFDLRNERAFRQILKLYALEKNEDSLAMLESTVRGVAIEAARDCAAAEPPDIRGAFTYLKMARPEAAEYMAMASLHRVLGTLDEELKNAAGIQGHAGHLARYTLLAAAGRLPEAAAEAEQAGLPFASARLQLIQGDPLPWLREAPAPPQAVTSAGLPDYRDYAVAAWEGKKPNAELVRRFRSLARSGDDEEQAKGLMMLFLTGDYKEGEKVLLRRDVSAAFYYLESSERVEEALRLLEIDPEKPDYTAWVARRFEVIIDDPDSEETEYQELSLLGYFLERRGLHREVEEAFVPPLMELAAASQENFLAGVSRLLALEAEDDLALPVVRPVLKACSLYAGDDDVRWAQVIENLFGTRGSAGDLWRWLADLEPELKRPERLELMASISGYLPDAGDRRSGFYEKAWKVATKAEGPERRRQLELLAGASEPQKRGDRRMGETGLFIRCVEELEKLDGGAGDWKLKKAHFLGTLGRWQEAAAVWLELGAAMPGEPVYWGYAAACMRRGGQEEEAMTLEKKAELLSMGETRALGQIGYYFALSGDFDRAGEWWRRAAIECTNDQRSFSDILGYLAFDAGAREDWKMAAAISAARTLEEAMAGRSSNALSSHYLRQRLESDLMRAFSRLSSDKEGAVAIIEECVEVPFADTLLADYFFAAMRRAGLVKMHDEIFEGIWKRISKVIERFPEGENTRNSAAWLASRANRRLDEAEKHAARALKTYPRQAAYLDTMAEVHFARGDRAKALEFSTRGLQEEPGDLQLIHQHQRFEKGDFPPK